MKGIEKRFVRKVGGGGTEFIKNEGREFPKPDWDGGNDEEYDHAETGDSEGQYVLGEVKAGDLVLIHGNLLHKSERNTSKKGRIIYTFHVIEGEGAIYDSRNWLQPPKEGFTKL